MGLRLKSLLAQDQVARVFCIGQLCSPKIVEMYGLMGGYHGLWLDHEHAGLSIAQIEEASRAARACGLDAFVRLAATDYASVMRCLEAGASGIMAAQVRSAAQAKDIVTWSRFHPHGLRGFNGTGVDGNYGTLPAKDYMQQANARTFVAIQIEHVDALNDVEAIAAIPGIDILFIGPADLSQSMGFPGEWDHPRLWQGIERVAKACKQRGIHWAILPRDEAYAQRCVDLGCRMLSIGIDVWAVAKGIRVTQREYGRFFGDVGDAPSGAV